MINLLRSVWHHLMGWHAAEPKTGRQMTRAERRHRTTRTHARRLRRHGAAKAGYKPALETPKFCRSGCCSTKLITAPDHRPQINEEW